MREDINDFRAVAFMSMREVIESIEMQAFKTATGGFEKFMNSPVCTNKAYVQLNSRDGNKYIHCPWCGKRNFRVQEDTKIQNLVYVCKNAKCKREFNVEI